MDEIVAGKIIAELRKKKGLTQKQLAAVLGVTDKAVSLPQRLYRACTVCPSSLRASNPHALAFASDRYSRSTRGRTIDGQTSAFLRLRNAFFRAARAANVERG